jgi:hypothetical protein
MHGKKSLVRLRAVGDPDSYDSVVPSDLFSKRPLAAEAV